MSYNRLGQLDLPCFILLYLTIRCLYFPAFLFLVGFLIYKRRSLLSDEGYQPSLWKRDTVLMFHNRLGQRDHRGSSFLYLVNVCVFFSLYLSFRFTLSSVRRDLYRAMNTVRTDYENEMILLLLLLSFFYARWSGW